MVLFSLTMLFPVAGAAEGEPDYSSSQEVIWQSGDTDCRIVAEGTEIYFRGCNIHIENDEGSTGTSNALGGCTQLTTLNLQGCTSLPEPIRRSYSSLADIVALLESQ